MGTCRPCRQSKWEPLALLANPFFVQRLIKTRVTDMIKARVTDMIEARVTAGKSTFAQRLLKQATVPWQHVNQDTIRPGSNQRHTSMNRTHRCPLPPAMFCRQEHLCTAASYASDGALAARQPRHHQARGQAGHEAAVCELSDKSA